jgi:hypothetical protein
VIGYCNGTEHGGTCLYVVVGPLEAGCTVGEEGCTTGYGVSTSTVCVTFSSEHGETTCLERCELPSEHCGEDRMCVPLAFEAGGVCALP